MLYLIGLGLDWKDVPLKALEAISKCDELYLESYTSLANYSKLQLERLFGKKVTELNRKQVEEEKPFLKSTHVKDVALLTYGDPLTATTHIEILQHCKKHNLSYEVIHSTSVFSALGETGLQLYKFGKTSSIPFWRNNYEPSSFYDILKANQSINAHTLFLLDLEPEKDNFLTIKRAIEQLLIVADRLHDKTFNEHTMCIGCARLGTTNKKIVYSKAKDLMNINFGAPPYCLIIPSKLHFAEEDFLKNFS